MLIRLYGEYWNPDIVDWGKRGPGNKGRLIGYFQKKSEVRDYWDARGIYALFDEFRLVYVGQAMSQGIGKRVRDHLTDRMAGRWDMFSWFSTSTMREKTVRDPGQRQVTPGEVVNTLEALAIAVNSPPLNRRYNAIPGARRVEQSASPHPKTVRHYLESILSKLENQ